LFVAGGPPDSVDDVLLNLFPEQGNVHGTARALAASPENAIADLRAPQFFTASRAKKHRNFLVRKLV
jgi:hypothetical protein